MCKTETTFGDLLRQLRSAAALSQEDLAERSGLSRRGISDLERGASHAPRPETVRLLADGLSLAADERAALIAAARPAAWQDGPAALGRLPPSSLPVPLTRLIGRETEVAALYAALQDEDVRLLTLTGPGGVGKTRLAVAVAATMAGDVPDGVVFVDLSPLTDPDLVVPTVASALGVRESAGRLVDTLATFLAPQRLLLVLDNCERVLAVAPGITTLLKASPGLTVFATSREPFRVRGEQEFPLAPLPLPASDRPGAVAEVAGSPAVALFGERASAVQPGFALTEDTTAAVAAICRRLDGLPLAIELAAAWVKVLPPTALLARLEHRLPLLTGGAHDLPARQRTMRDAIAWSYDLLAPEEQALFRRLAVFVGGFSFAAADAVSRGVTASRSREKGPAVGGQKAGRRDGQAILDLLAGLIDKSLLLPITANGLEPRFAMLETVREFALEHLAAAGEERAIRELHARWCLHLAEELEPLLFSGRDAAPSLARLDAELDNLRAAIGWFSASRRHAEMLRLIVAIRHYLGVRPHPAEVMRWLEAGLRQGADVSVHSRALALCLAIYMSYDLDDVPAVTAYAEDAIALASEVGDPVIRGEVHYCAGVAWTMAGDLARAARDFDEALAQFRTVEVPLWVATTLQAVADLRLIAGDAASAISIMDEALAIHRQLGPSWSFAGVLCSRAHAALKVDDPVLAATLLHEGIAMAEDLADLRTLMGLVASLAGVAMALGQAKRGVRLLGAIEMARASIGIRRTSQAAHVERITTEVRDRLAEPVFTAAWAEGRSLSFADAVADAVAFCASVLEAPALLQDPGNPFGLTPREIDVLRLLVEGRSDREIANALFIGARTAQTHVANLFTKFGVNTRAEAAAVAVRHGLV